MVRKKRRKFSLEFKREAVRLFESGGKLITVIARELGVHVNLLGSWVKQFEKPPMLSSMTSAEVEEELKQLRKDKARLEMEVEILGKATVYSTGHRNTTTSDSWLKVVTDADSQARLVSRRKG